MVNFKLLSIVKVIIGKKRGAHDLSHILRVRNIALEIAESEGANIDVVEAMVLLHDLIRYEDKREPLSVSETLQIAEKVLRNLKWSDENIELVLDGIASHSLHSNIKREPETIEAKILFDADKIDSVGEIGVARWFMTMARQNVSIHESAKIYLDTIENMEKKLGGKLYTKKGNKLIQPGLKFSKKFMRQLLK